MKINNDGPGALTNGAEPLARTTGESGGAKSRPASSATDALKLSPEGRFMQEAAVRSAGSPEIRQDVVDRMKALLDAGKIGNDTAALADSMIDDWLQQP